MSVRETLLSEEEKIFYDYLLELKDNGYIKSINHEPSPIKLSNSVKLRMIHKGKDKEVTLLREHIYTADFEVIWLPKSEGIFCGEKVNFFKDKTPFYSHKNYSILEIKPVFDHQGMQRKFSIDQKWVYDAHGIYVQKIIPQELFKNTFTPKTVVDNYVYQRGKNKGKSKIKWKIKTLEQYVSERNATRNSKPSKVTNRRGRKSS